MQQTLKRTSLTLLISGALSVGAVNSGWAAQVPAGVQLAQQQNIVINNGSEVASLDPHKVEGVPESNIILNLLEGLVSTDANGHVVPAAAASWENQNYQQWTFHLRPGAVWSDGSPVTAQDFVYSWQRLADPKIVGY